MTMQRQPEDELMDLPAEAAAYAQADFSQVNDAFVVRLIGLIGGRPCRYALDLGTGPADIPIRLVRRLPGVHVTAVDASPAMLELAARAVQAAGLTSRIDLVLADAKAAPLSGGRFDAIFSNSILHHIDDTASFWREVKRAGAPGAVVFMRDLARPASPADARQLTRQYAGGESPLLQEEYYRSLLAAYTPDEVRAQLSQAGLSDLHVEMVTDRHMDIANCQMPIANWQFQ